MTPDFHGLPARSLENDHLRVDYLLEAGPRLVRLIPAGSADNLLAEVPDVHWPTPWGEYHLRGGHRLAIAPEALELSYVPEGSDLIVEDMPGGGTAFGQVQDRRLTRHPGCIAASQRISIHARTRFTRKVPIRREGLGQNAAQGLVQGHPLRGLGCCQATG